MRSIISRRHFVRSVSSAAALGSGVLLAGRSVSAIVAAAAPENNDNNAAPPTPRFSLGEATHESFAPYVGTAFRIVGPDGRVTRAELTGTQVAPRHGRPVHMRDPFSLTFTSSTAASTPSSAVEIRHDDLGRFDLFLTAHDQQGVRTFEAVFG